MFAASGANVYINLEANQKTGPIYIALAWVYNKGLELS